jgi:ABC-type cobalt transport system substrate-binding protein
MYWVALEWLLILQSVVNHVLLIAIVQAGHVLLARTKTATARFAGANTQMNEVASKVRGSLILFNVGLDKVII